MFVDVYFKHLETHIQTKNQNFKIKWITKNT